MESLQEQLLSIWQPVSAVCFLLKENALPNGTFYSLRASNHSIDVYGLHKSRRSTVLTVVKPWNLRSGTLQLPRRAKAGISRITTTKAVLLFLLDFFRPAELRIHCPSLTSLTRMNGYSFEYIKFSLLFFFVIQYIIEEANQPILVLVIVDTNVVKIDASLLHSWTILCLWVIRSDILQAHQLGKELNSALLVFIIHVWACCWKFYCNAQTTTSTLLAKKARFFKAGWLVRAN